MRRDAHLRFEAQEAMPLQPLAERAYRPLVLPAARTIRRSVPHRLASTLPAVEVERRVLAAYRQLAESLAEEVA